ncbi:MAG: slipin family protein [Candidatus Aenigmarchaeota archaeon]|nr:slipin family protein [Candidatus Aenigmarchaeota archaeon]
MDAEFSEGLPERYVTRLSERRAVAGSSNIPATVGIMIFLLSLLIGFFISQTEIVLGFLVVVSGLILAVFVGSSIVVNQQWEEAIVLRVGRYNRTKKEGVFFKVPIFEQVIRRDMRITTLDIEKQSVITKDNISVGVNAVVFMKIINAEKSITQIEDHVFSVKQYSQTTLRDVIGQVELDELLSQRERIAKKIKDIIDVMSTGWGVDIVLVELQDIELPDDMKRVMARQAEAEREKRAVIIKSEGEVKAANNLAAAAKKLSEVPAALQLRTLETISDVSQDQSNTILFAIPLESFGMDKVALAALAESMKARKGRPDKK